MYRNIALIGSSGAIGNAILTQLSCMHPNASINAFTRNPPPHTSLTNVTYNHVDYSDEKSLSKAAAICTQQKRKLDLVLLTTGTLHSEFGMPEKSLRDINAEQFSHVLYVNTIVPALVSKHFLPHIERDRRSVFAALSARVGSISDNRLGGWYSYRASKAALNMVIKNASIEVGRRYKEAVVVGLHPGTVASDLSEPFQKNVPQGKLFTPESCAEYLLGVIDNLTPEDSGKCFGWDGEEIHP